MAGIIGEAFVRVRPDMRGFRGDLRREATSASRGLGKIIGAGLGIGIGFGIEREFEKAIDKAKEAEVVSKRLEAALRAQGISWQDNADYIEQNIQALSKLSSFEDEELKASFINLLRRTNDVNKALQLNALAADVARGSGLSLTTVAKALGRAYSGQTAGLTRLGIAVKKGVSGQEALDAVSRKYAGAAEAYANTAAGAQDRLNKTLDDSREIIGGALLPVITDLSTRFADYLEKQNESGELQRKVNTVMKQAGQIVSDLADALGTVKAVVGPVVNAVGGLGTALQLAIGLKFASMLRNGAAGFGLLGASVARTSAAGVAEATTFSRAWDAATRPRNMVVTTTYVTPTGPGRPGQPTPTTPVGSTGLPPYVYAGGGAAAAGGASAARRFLRRKPSLVQRINQYGRGIPTSLASKLPTGFIAGTVLYGGFTIASAAGQREGTPAYNFKTGQWMVVFTDPSGQTSILNVPEGAIAKEFPRFYQGVRYRIARQRAARFRAPAPPPGPDEGTRGPGAPTTAKPKVPDTGVTGGITAVQSLRLQLAAAEREGNLPAQRTIQAKIVAIFQRRVDTTKLRGQAYVRFQQELSTEEDKYDSINDQIAADRARKASDRASDREKRAQDAQDAQDKADAKLLRRLERGRRPVNRAIERAARTEGTRDDVATAKALIDRIDHDIAIVRANVKNLDTRNDALDALYADRETAVGNWIDAKTRHAAAIKTKVEEAQAKRTSDLDLILQIAQLTDDPGAIGRALDAVIADDRKLLARARKAGTGVLEAILKLRTDLKAKRDLLGKDTAGGKTGTTAYDLLTASIGEFSGGNLINADQPFAGPQGFIAPLVPFLRRVPGKKYPGSLTGTATTGGGKTAAEQSIDRLIAALDRNTASRTGEPTGHPPAARNRTSAALDPRVRHGLSDGRYYESARARENVGSRGGV